MKNFKSLNIEKEIYTTDTNPIEKFFNPVLKLSKTYDIAVGYFTSGWIRDAAEGIASLYQNKGKSRWVINPELSEKDWAIFETLKDEERIDFISNIIDKSFESLFKELKEDTSNAISWLIYKKILEFRIAVPTKKLKGIFHPKIGIFTDIDENKIAFTGSYNSTSAANTNWEQIEIFCSWKEADRVELKENKFNKIWNRHEENLKIYEPTKETLLKLIDIRNKYKPPIVFESMVSDQESQYIPSRFLKDGKLMAHQEEAISNWGKNNFHGIFNMATGSGKTVTALSTSVKLVNRLNEKGQSLGIIITVPYKHLADQWETEAKNFGFNVLKCYGDYKQWIDNAISEVNNLKSNLSNHLFIITSNATFMKSKFQNILELFNKFDLEYLFIADEMHNLGGMKLKESLPEKARFRLGLSATPERYMDEIGTKVIKDYFGKEVIQFGIKEALENNTLCKYYYYPVLVNLTDKEEQEYKKLSVQISKLCNSKIKIDSSTNAVKLKILLLKRSRILANADNKIVTLKEYLIKDKESFFNLVYCGDEIEYDILDEENSEKLSSSTDVKQVEKILKMIGTEIGMRTNKFTAVEDQEKRDKLLKQFTNKDLQVLVAIRCLDEGVDIPRTETAYILASSSNPRQFIQRRGRVLRKAEGKKYAKIFDFVVTPKIEQIDFNSEFNIERNLFKRELKRVNEFAEMSLNSGESLKIMRELKIKLNLLDL